MFGSSKLAHFIKVSGILIENCVPSLAGQCYWTATFFTKIENYECPFCPGKNVELLPLLGEALPQASRTKKSCFGSYRNEGKDRYPKYLQELTLSVGVKT